LAGQHCQQVHEHLVENSQDDLGQVQADEIKMYFFCLASAQTVIAAFRMVYVWRSV
jgi:hypothetical protein